MPGEPGIPSKNPPSPVGMDLSPPLGAVGRSYLCVGFGFFVGLVFGLTEGSFGAFVLLWSLCIVDVVGWGVGFHISSSEMYFLEPLKGVFEEGLGGEFDLRG